SKLTSLTSLESSLESSLDAPLESSLDAPLESSLDAPLESSLEASLESSLDAPLQVLYLGQPSLLRERALTKYKSQVRGEDKSEYEAMVEADDMFVREEEEGLEDIGGVGLREGEEQLAEPHFSGLQTRAGCRADLKSHKATHGIGGFLCDIPGCTHRAGSRVNLESHKATNHDIGGFPCDIPGCTYRAGSRANLERHKNGKKHKEKYGSS
ncbi:hypothetical protein TrRE_jg12205, partial [Triparma retinervis]